jgi:peptidoglycan/LPS O-acetylase OafA/YrhL
LLFVSLAATIAIASASWHLLERPINDFKRRFPYDRTVQSPALAMAAMEAAPERSAQRA